MDISNEHQSLGPPEHHTAADSTEIPTPTDHGETLYGRMRDNPIFRSESAFVAQRVVSVRMPRRRPRRARRRELAVRLHNEGLGRRTIAAMMDISANTVNTHLYRARRIAGFTQEPDLFRMLIEPRTRHVQLSMFE